MKNFVLLLLLSSILNITGNFNSHQKNIKIATKSQIDKLEPRNWQIDKLEPRKYKNILVEAINENRKN